MRPVCLSCVLILLSLLSACETRTKTVNSCGDGFLDPGEVCDGQALGGASCAELGYHEAGGLLACTDDCRLDVSGCGDARCGDGLLQEAFQEQCDGDELDGQSCLSLGYERGTLSCGEGCRFDVSDCVGAGQCGDLILQVPEDCDGSDLGGQTCVTLGYYSGTLACGVNCHFDLGTCQHRCGDGFVDTTYQEVCDGLNLGGQTCESRGYHPGGTLACAADCRAFDEVDCAAVGRCGDGLVQGLAGETCDGTNLDGHTCESLGFVEGTPGCGPDCRLDTSGCTMNLESPTLGTLIYVPAGTFQRDSVTTNLGTVTAFRMSRFEVTRAQWTAVTGWADPSNTAHSASVNDPVQRVSWYDAIAFCNRLSLLENLTPVYSVSGVDFSTLTYGQIPSNEDANWNGATANWSANGYRLPTEMEWMWAAMGADTDSPGTVNTSGHLKAFAGSDGTNVVGDFAVFGYETTEPGRTTTQRTSPAGSKAANELGFQDLSGNVWEWLWDWLGPSPGGTVVDGRGPASGIHRGFHGGSWLSSASNCTVAARSGYYPNNRDSVNGFRVVRP